ncbi:MAG TPA: plastocyanin/azurin family copper-binding protein [Gemmatimonadales bacterium]|nr:plastocyanin/azurin family copper-binding protein [Gemmatimonadales bacterium]
MKRHRGIRIAVTLALLSVAGLAVSCGKDNPGPTGPPAARELDSGNINGGGTTFAHTFPMTDPATYNYHCTIHGGMNGSVHVQTGHPATAAVTITDNVFTPATALVAPGGTVTWTNNGSTHTVTSN